MKVSQIESVFLKVDGELAALEARIARGEALPLAPTVDAAIGLIRQLLIAYIDEEGKKRVPEAGAEILDVFKAFVRGDPTWNAMRDNCRELVYYRNCINMGREDALPRLPDKMAVRTARHVYLYMKTRCIREGRLGD
ncbi:MAG: hypothetical protein HY526_08915 [Betaproteobacteria bacterium]|nr:hypothetical protein [Betaproteobacteria bacterium]